MSTTTDLTPERLDELEYEYGEEDRDDPRVLTLIAMAKRTEQAERERDALRTAMGTIAKHAMEEHSCGDPDVVAALAQPTVCESLPKEEQHD